MQYSDKPKRTGNRISGYGLMLAGFLLGIVVTLVIVAPRLSAQGVSYNDNPPVDLYLTATYFVEQATRDAGGVIEQPSNLSSGSSDQSLMATATALVLQATRQASGNFEQPSNFASGSGDQSLMATATAIVLQATAAAP